MTSEQVSMLIKTDDIDKIKQAFIASKVVESVSAVLKNYEIANHEVMDPTIRRDKMIKGDDGNIEATVKVSRIPLPYQKNIVLVASAFLGTPQINATPGDQKEKDLLSVIKKVLDDNKVDYKFMTVVKTTKSEKQAAILLYTEKLQAGSDYWDNEPISSNLRLRMKLLSCKRGDELYPVFDDSDDMVAFGRAYETSDTSSGSEVKTQHFDFYTADNIYINSKVAGRQWEKKSFKNLINKIPVIYFCQAMTDYEDVQHLIDRLEKKTSNHADTNDYFDSPIVKAKGKITGFANKGDSGKVLEMDEGADAGYLTYDSLPESMKMEIDNLKEYIEQFSHTPVTAASKMAALSYFSSTAIKLLFLDAHLKAYDSEEIFGEGAQRLFNYIKAAIAVMDSSFKKATKLKLTPKFTYFLPKNETEEVANIVSAYTAGIISLETALSLNPLVEDAIAELEKIKAEAKAKADAAPPPPPTPAQ